MSLEASANPSIHPASQPDIHACISCSFVCVHARLPACLHACIYIYIYIHIHIHMYIYIYICICMHICRFMRQDAKYIQLNYNNPPSGPVARRRLLALLWESSVLRPPPTPRNRSTLQAPNPSRVDAKALCHRLPTKRRRSRGHEGARFSGSLPYRV